jgi:hypothetical protein
LNHSVFSGELFMSVTTPFVGTDIRQKIDFDSHGRTACPACIQDGKTQQKKLMPSQLEIDTDAVG